MKKAEDIAEAQERMKHKKLEEIRKLEKRNEEIDIVLGNLTHDGKLFGSDLDRLMRTEPENEVLRRAYDKRNAENHPLIMEQLQNDSRIDDIRKSLGMQTSMEHLAEHIRECGFSEDETEMVTEFMETLKEMQ